MSSWCSTEELDCMAPEKRSNNGHGFFRPTKMFSEDFIFIFIENFFSPSLFILCGILKQKMAFFFSDLTFKLYIYRHDLPLLSYFMRNFI